MAKRKTIDDKDFGRLEHVAGLLWSRQVSLPHFGREWLVPLSVDCEDACSIDENQRLACREFFAHLAEIAGLAESWIVGYARDSGIVSGVIEDYVQPCGVDFPADCPLPTLGIRYDTSWDESHGAAVKIVDGIPVEVGGQDIIL